jgi:hypothetical protein
MQYSSHSGDSKRRLFKLFTARLTDIYSRTQQNFVFQGLNKRLIVLSYLHIYCDIIFGTATSISINQEALVSVASWVVNGVKTGCNNCSVWCLLEI